MKEIMSWIESGAPIGLIANYKFKELKDHRGITHKEKVRKWVKYPVAGGVGIVAWGRFGYLDLISTHKDFVVRVKNSRHKLLYLLYLSEGKVVSVNDEKCTLHMSDMERALMKLCVEREGTPLCMIARAELENWLDKKAPWNEEKILYEKYISFLVPSITETECIGIHRDLLRLPRKQALLKVLGQSGKAANMLFKYAIGNRISTNYALNVNGLKVEHLYDLLNNTGGELWEQEHVYRVGCLLPQRYHSIIKMYRDTDVIALSLVKSLGKNKFKHINYESMKDVHDYWYILNKNINTKDFKLAQDPELLKIEGEVIEGYTVVVPKYNSDLIEWGNKLGICVGSYGDSINNGTCLVVGLYKDGEIHLCVDIHNNGKNKAYTTQIKGKKNVDADDSMRLAVCEKLGIDGHFGDVTYTSKKRTKYKFTKMQTVKETLSQEAVYKMCDKAIYEFKKLRKSHTP